jgi:hypothetical protein
MGKWILEADLRTRRESGGKATPSGAAAVAVFMLLAFPAAAQGGGGAPPMNLYEWIAVAPEVVVAHIISQEGRYVLAGVETVLRGEIVSGTEILINLREANRSRTSSQLPLRLLHGERYILLLESGDRRKPKSPVSHLISRGVDGAWLMPKEGEAAFVSAVTRFLEIQETGSYALMWERFEEELESSPNPLVLEAVLQMHLKFRRGDLDLLLTLEPLLDHPRPTIRARTADLAALILERAGSEPSDEVEGVLPVLLARARRDPSVEVRVSATRAVGSLDGDRIESVLREIADEDKEQAVRYAAERLLFERGAGTPPGG